MLSSVHYSTELAFNEHINNNKNKTRQLILAYGALGRHVDIEDNVIHSIVSNLLKSMEDANDTIDIINLIHALGNTGSKKAIPYLLPFLYNSNNRFQLTAVDALRTVSRDETVQMTFASFIKHATSEDQVMQVVESLIFPFQKSVYYTHLPSNPGKSDSEQSLMKAIVDSVINRFHSVELTKLTISYLEHVDTDLAIELRKDLQDGLNGTTTRAKRGVETTTDWNSDEDNYNVIDSHASRTEDESEYPHHEALIWKFSFGKYGMYLRVAGGGFAGIGPCNYKLFAKFIIDLKIGKTTLNIVELEYQDQNSSALKYAKIAGIKFLDIDPDIHLPLSFSKSENFTDIQLPISTVTKQFYVKGFEFNIDVSTTLNLYYMFSSNLNLLGGTSRLETKVSATIEGSSSLKVLEVRCYFLIYEPKWINPKPTNGYNYIYSS